ncbi:MAG: Stk1 family PASTA domain-containing Ser/Thr kinase [Actinomycetaceae bacterium]|nr:Stk1 family PASTA domain-containing Ser/Thr kinase [Actinomycetaceae bacterium]
MKPDPLLGLTIDGRYTIHARLARGGMATVYRATDTRLERRVALKVIHSHLAEQPDFVDRFIREARSAAKLSNPHIVGVYDQGVAETPSGPLPYLVMELASGPDLRSQLATHGSLPLGVALDVTHQVLVALADAHANDIVHRDVKPENILLSAPLDPTAIIDQPTITAKVADFGLARAASSSTQTSTVLGTVGFVAPELVSDGIAGPSSDVYSVGVMLYELLSGQLPFTGDNALAVAYKHVHDPMPRLGDMADWIPPAIDSLIALFTAKNPSKRPQNGQAALDALEDIRASIPEELLIRRIPVFPTQRTEPTIVADQEPSATDVIVESENSATAASPDNPTKVISPKDASNLDQPTSGSPRRDTAALPEQTTVVTQTPQKKRGRRLGLIVFLLALFSAIGYGTYWYFTAGPGLRVAVPDVANMEVSEGRELLEDAGFTVTEERSYSDDVAFDFIISTDPPGQTKIHPDTPVVMLVSDGVEYLIVPDVVGMTADDAANTLEDARFVPVYAEEYSQDVPEGEVISQTPEAEESIPHSSEVTYVVSLGREPLVVPSVTGLDQDTAITTLEDTGFEVSVSEEYSDDIAKGTVISQSPQAEESMYRGDTVTITVSLGPELALVPNVIGMQESQARTALINAGFNVESEYVLYGYFGTVRLQSETAGTLVKVGTTITITIV